MAKADKGNKQWVYGKGPGPKSWHQAVEVLRQMEKDRGKKPLAEQIAEAVKKAVVK